MRFKNIVMAATLLTLAGCGCTDDSVNPRISGLNETVTYNVGTTIQPCELTASQAPTIRRIDIMIVIDDSWSMNNRNMGLIPRNDNDTRKRTAVAQAIMKDLEAQILQSIADQDANDAIVTAADADAVVDLAFGVGFLCDFGGPFAASGRSFPTDADARPFTLAMPMIRQKHELFSTMFQTAIEQDTPGDGRIVITPAIGTPFGEANDPQSSIEALYQIATGAGFDGDNDNDTNGSGAPCAPGTIGNPGSGFTAPGNSGDVPAVQFNAAADETDADGQGMYWVRDSNNNPTAIADPRNPNNTINCFASGNLGGVGWRNEAARFVILTSDIATVSPFSTPVPTEVTSTAGTTATVPADIPAPLPLPPTGIGPAMGPRLAAVLPTTAYESRAVAEAPGRRFGDPAVSPFIAPTNAATVPNTIAKLNNLHIEVLCVGYPNVSPDPVKPNGAPGTDIPEVEADTPAPPNPAPNTFEFPTLFPWTFMSATSLLTGSRIDFIDGNLQPQTAPAVYNAGTVAPSAPDGTALPITNHLREDLAQRILAWVNGGFLNEIPIGAGVGVNPAGNEIPTLTMPVRLTLTPSPTFDTNFTQLLPAPQVLQVVNVPMNVAGMTPNTGVDVTFSDIGHAIQTISDPPIARTVSDTMMFRIEALVTAAVGNDPLTGIVITEGSADNDVSQQLFDQLSAKVAVWQRSEIILLTEASLIVSLEEITLNPDSPEVEENEVSVQTFTPNTCGFLNIVNDFRSPVPPAIPPSTTLPQRVPIGPVCNPLAVP